MESQSDSLLIALFVLLIALAAVLSGLIAAIWQLSAARKRVTEVTAEDAALRGHYKRALAALKERDDEIDSGARAQEQLLAQEASLRSQVEYQSEQLEQLKREISQRPKVNVNAYKIVVIGERSTGKTSLILKWANPLWEVKNPPGATLFNRLSRTVSSVTHTAANVVVNHVFEVYDFGGERVVDAQETLVVEDVHGLLFVVDLGDEGSASVDRERIQRQVQAFSRQALQFFCGPRIVKTCQTMVLFINKSDLVSGTPMEVEREALRLYQPLIAALKEFEEQIDVQVMVGSGHSGHNTHLLMPHFVRKLLPEDAYDEQLQQRAQGLA